MCYISFLNLIVMREGLDLQCSTEQRTACCFHSTDFKNDFPVVDLLMLDCGCTLVGGNCSVLLHASPDTQKLHCVSAKTCLYATTIRFCGSGGLLLLSEEGGVYAGFLFLCELDLIRQNETQAVFYAPIKSSKSGFNFCLLWQ